MIEVRRVLNVLVYIALLALNVWIFLIWAQEPWHEKVTWLLNILTLYAFIFGLLTQIEPLRYFGNLIEHMTSPNLFQFMSGNLKFFAILSFLFSVGMLHRQPEEGEHYVLALLKIPVTAVGFLIIQASLVFYTVVILPIAYIAYAIVSLFIPKIPYLFSWDDVPGNDSEKLLKSLVDVYDIKWAESAEISRSDDGKTIYISKDENSAEITINEEEEKANLKFSDDKIHGLKVKKIEDKINIYILNNLDKVISKDISSKIDLSLTDIVITHGPLLRSFAVGLLALTSSTILKTISILGWIP